MIWYSVGKFRGEGFAVKLSFDLIGEVTQKIALRQANWGGNFLEIAGFCVEAYATNEYRLTKDWPKIFNIFTQDPYLNPEVKPVGIYKFDLEYYPLPIYLETLPLDITEPI